MENRADLRPYSLYRVDSPDSMEPVFPEEDKGKRRTSKCRSWVQQRLPITKWIKTYKKSYLVSDVVAGLTVGMTVVPQSMGFAALAGLTPEYGLYSAYIGCFLYIIFGGCRQVTVGPVSLLSLIVFQTCGSDFPECAVWLSFYSGIFQLLMAVLQLGVVVSFISEPVTVGFTAGAAVTTISAQIRNFLGMSGVSGSDIVGIWRKIIENIHTVSTGDSVMGVGSFLALMLLQRVKDMKPPKSWNQLRWKKIFWYVSVIRNALIVVSTTIIAFAMSNPPFQLTGKVQGGLPGFRVPLISVPSHDNSTGSSEDDMLSFKETWQKYSTAPIVAAIIAILQNVAISKAFGIGQSVDATQEMLTLGITNVFGSFFGAIPSCGSFSRSAVNDASGVKSPLGGLFTGLLVLASLVFLTPTFYYIPKASLAAVIISAVMTMIEYNALLPMWRISRFDVMICIITFLTSVFLSMEYGIAVGVGISIAALLVQTLKPPVGPKLKVDVSTGSRYLLVKPEHGLNFPSIDHLRTQVNKITYQYDSVRFLVIDLERWTTWDYTVINSLVSLERGMKKADVALIFFHCGAPWQKALEAAGLANPACCSCDEELSEILLRGRADSML